eukprot:8525767-Pyramimonas_sp.AAC.1
MGRPNSAGDLLRRAAMLSDTSRSGSGPGSAASAPAAAALGATVSVRAVPSCSGGDAPPAPAP